MASTKRQLLERKLRVVNHDKFLAQRGIQEATAAFQRAKQASEDLKVQSHQLQKELVELIGPPLVPKVKPKCWCCSCANQSSKHEGCKACWVRDDVQRWLDALEGIPSKNQMTEDHGTGFGCPGPDREQCPGWEAKQIRPGKRVQEGS